MTVDVYSLLLSDLEAPDTIALFVFNSFQDPSILLEFLSPSFPSCKNRRHPKKSRSHSLGPALPGPPRMSPTLFHNFRGHPKHKNWQERIHIHWLWTMCSRAQIGSQRNTQINPVSPKFRGTKRQAYFFSWQSLSAHQMYRLLDGDNDALPLLEILLLSYTFLYKLLLYLTSKIYGHNKKAICTG